MQDGEIKEERFEVSGIYLLYNCVKLGKF